jgi:hypothetical protein
VDEKEARGALAQVMQARRRAFELRNYRLGSSVVSIWGVAWLVGFASSQFAPQASAWVWLACWMGALAWMVTRPRSPHDLPALATWAVGIAFVFLLLLMIRADLRTAGVISTLVIAASYSVLGIWAGRRFAVLGAIVTLSACIGWWLVPQFLFLLLGIGGGGALLLGGLWLRQP